MLKTNAIEVIILFITSLLLAWIAYDDFKFRTIRAMILPIIFGLLLWHRVLEESFSLLLTSLLFNLFYITFLGLSVVGYLFLRYKVSWSRLSSYIGIGDLFFIISICVWFDGESFIAFTIVSLLVALLGSRVWKQEIIPLAGYQSICFFCFYLLTALPV